MCLTDTPLPISLKGRSNLASASHSASQPGREYRLDLLFAIMLHVAASHPNLPHMSLPEYWAMDPVRSVINWDGKGGVLTGITAVL